MRHSYFGKKLSRTKNERKNLLRNLARSMFLHGSIKTSKAKAQAVRGMVEKLITKAKKGTEQKKREIFSVLHEKDIVEKLMDMASTRFASRTSGFTRMVHLGPRRGDATEEVILSFVDEAIVTEVVTPKGEKAVKSERKPVVVKEPEKKEKPARIKKPARKSVKK